jgi:ribosomal protein L40E
VSGSIRHKAKEIFVCPLCQVENRATAKFCRRCGKTRAELDSIVKSEIRSAGVAAPDIEESTSKQEDRVPAAAEVEQKELITFVYAGPEPLRPGASGDAVLETCGQEALQADIRDPHIQDPDIQDPDIRDPEVQDPDVRDPDVQDPDVQDISGGQEQGYVPPHCFSCHSGLRSTDKFCSWCGEPQPNRLYPYLKVCPGCDQRLPHRANYCFACGRDVGVHPRVPMRMPTELFNEEESEFFPTFEA